MNSASQTSPGILAFSLTDPSVGLEDPFEILREILATKVGLGALGEETSIL